MSVSVGVDGGQSEIRLRVSGEQDAASAPGVSHLEADTIEAIVHIVAKLWDGRDLGVSRLMAGLTTVPASSEDRRSLATGLAEATGASEVWVSDDTVTAHAGALDGATGVVLSVGTGVACLAINAETGARRSFDGAGYLIGDEGGGFWLGRHGIRAVIAAEEGRGPRTSLTNALEPQLGPMDGLAIRLHSNPRAVNTISQLASVILAEAAAGDRVAEYIVGGAGAHLVDTASAAARFLSPSPDVVVALGGGLLISPPTSSATSSAPIERSEYFLPQERSDVGGGGAEGDGRGSGGSGEAGRGASYLAELVIEGLQAAFPELEVSMAKGTGLDGACALAGAATPGPYQDLITIYRSSS